MTVFVQGWAPASLTQIYTNGSGFSQILDYFSARNNDTNPQSFSVSVVPNGTVTPDNSHIRLSVILNPSQTLDYPAALIGQDLDPGDSVWLISGTAQTISVRCTGRTK